MKVIDMIDNLPDLPIMIKVDGKIRPNKCIQSLESVKEDLSGIFDGFRFVNAITMLCKNGKHFTILKISNYWDCYTI